LPTQQILDLGKFLLVANRFNEVHCFARLRVNTTAAIDQCVHYEHSSRSMRKKQGPPNLPFLSPGVYNGFFAYLYGSQLKSNNFQSSGCSCRP
jgi:hypothetical protein